MGDLDARTIERALETRGTAWGRPLVVCEVTTSTSDDAKRAARLGAPSGALFVADTQTGGRGRLGRTWFSPPGENLYASFVLRPSLEARRVPLVTIAAGIAVADVLAPLVGGDRVKLKWPNDVFIDGRKVAGILAEAQLTGEGAPWIVVGIGINVRTKSFPEEIAARATSLALCGSASLDRGEILVRLAEALFRRLETLGQSPLRATIDDFSLRDALVGQSVTVDGATAVALGLDDDGALRVRYPDGRETRCLAGDVLLSISAH